ncbi:arsenate reductase (glutaredoxin) [Corynebacterium sp. 13CS0277]|uniref:arsenate reductase family protein n=1 Tax=Corynebacterium sp. 13CS0277 TaxID=2071994 RepID=UPI000D025673|nr:arsenate reductase family protein [Corynebacterium sp. 13CS0277]PRQ12270.1 arsenate reductase (glutaredoxin) [Corynebacterium sp. 13CS0277]
MSFTILHNPRCSKSRAALAALEDAGETVTIRAYLSDPLTEDELRETLRRGGLTPAEVVRAEEPLAAELGLTADSPAEELLAAMAEHPQLLNRPIVIRDADGRAVLGRPLDTVYALMKDHS